MLELPGPVLRDSYRPSKDNTECEKRCSAIKWKVVESYRQLTHPIEPLRSSAVDLLSFGITELTEADT